MGSSARAPGLDWRWEGQRPWTYTVCRGVGLQQINKSIKGPTPETARKQGFLKYQVCEKLGLNLFRPVVRASAFESFLPQDLWAEGGPGEPTKSSSRRMSLKLRSIMRALSSNGTRLNVRARLRTVRWIAGGRTVGSLTALQRSKEGKADAEPSPKQKKF